jgi:hypothetical protein
MFSVFIFCNSQLAHLKNHIQCTIEFYLFFKDKRFTFASENNRRIRGHGVPYFIDIKNDN